MGARAIIAVKGSVDASNPKVIRSSAGSVFHLPIVPLSSFDEACQRLRDQRCVILGTSGAQGAYSLSELMSQAALQGIAASIKSPAHRLLNRQLTHRAIVFEAYLTFLMRMMSHAAIKTTMIATMKTTV